MKAYIGNYRTYGWLYKIIYFNDFTEKCLSWVLKLMPNRIQYVKIDKQDWISVKSTLPLILVPLLKEFKKNTKSYPISMDEEKWAKILDRMIFAFENVDNVNDKVTYDAVTNGINLFARHYQDLWS